MNSNPLVQQLGHHLVHWVIQHKGLLHLEGFTAEVTKNPYRYKDCYTLIEQSGMKQSHMLS